MERLTSRQLKLIRNIIMLVGIVLAFVIWLSIPATIENNRLVHVGNGKYGNKLGVLVLLGLPFFALIPIRPYEEIHAEDPDERAKIAEERERESAKAQILHALGESLAACGGMLLFLFFG